MKTLFACLMFLFLSACNGSDTDATAVPSAPGVTQAQLESVVAPLRSEIAALQASNKKLTLIGKAHGVPSGELRLQGEFRTEAASTPVSFGPCSDMGVFEGATDANGNGPLGALYQAFKNCTGTHAEYDPNTGNLKTVSRLYFTSSDCSGQSYVWQEGGQGFNLQILDEGVAFVSPIDGTALWVKPHQTPTLIQVQSAFIISNGDCEPDGDLELMWATSANDTSQNGVPISAGAYQLVAP